MELAFEARDVNMMSTMMSTAAHSCLARYKWQQSGLQKKKHFFFPKKIVWDIAGSIFSRQKSDLVEWQGSSWDKSQKYIYVSFDALLLWTVALHTEYLGNYFHNTRHIKLALDWMEFQNEKKDKQAGKIFSFNRCFWITSTYRKIESWLQRDF